MQIDFLTILRTVNVIATAIETRYQDDERFTVGELIETCHDICTAMKLMNKTVIKINDKTVSVELILRGIVNLLDAWEMGDIAIYQEEGKNDE